MNGLLCIDKDEEMTSFDVVRQIKRTFKTKKVGHSGTLDPNATGVLVVAINRATKSLQYLDVYDKVYHAKIKLGMKTHTGDIWGDTIEEKPIENFTEEQLIDTLIKLTGPQKQRVPMVSAKKVDGKRLYQYVLDNEETETLYTSINIYKIKLISWSLNEIEIRAHVSNGTYIRTLCEDIGESLNNLASMSYLRREKVGGFSLENSLKLEEISSETPLLSVKEHVKVPIERALEHRKAIMHGQRIELDTEFDQLLLDADDYFAIYKRENDKIFKSVRGLW